MQKLSYRLCDTCKFGIGFFGCRPMRFSSLKEKMKNHSQIVIYKVDITVSFRVGNLTYSLISFFLSPPSLIITREGRQRAGDIYDEPCSFAFNFH